MKKLIFMPDLSDLLHVDDKGNFRDFTINEDNAISKRVRRTYYEMHRNQTVEYVEKQHKKWLKFDHAELTIMEALEILNGIIDESDPDVDLPNIIHAFQTAERIREKHPDKPWFQLTGLIHDVGKLMAFYEEPHWAVCGDTYPVGCRPDDNIVFGLESFSGNKDMLDLEYQKEIGIYSEKCGLDNIKMSWGHDEYLYWVLLHNKSTLPEIALKVIRYHSFYPWHNSGAYTQFMNEDDKETLKWVKEFNKFDLYSKSDTLPDIPALKEYYQKLIDQYVPGKIKF